MWISHFSVEWLDNLPVALRDMPKGHPTTWHRVLWGELREDPRFVFHIVTMTKHVREDVSWTVGNTTFHVVKTRGGFRAPSYFWYDTLLVRRLVQRLCPDVIHAWGTERGAALVAARLGLPYLVTIQGLMSWYVRVVPPGWYDRLAALVEHRVFKLAPLVTTESRFAYDFIKRIAPELRVEQVEHAPTGLFHRLCREPARAPVRFLYVGAMNARKGFDTLLRALDQLGLDTAWELAVTGQADHPYAQSLKPGLSAETWSRIRFLGDLKAEAVAAELSRALLLVFPTRADTSPNAVKEAAVAGVPVVGTSVGGIPDYITHGKNGLLVDPGNPEAFAAAVREALNHPLFGRGLVDEDTLLRVRAYLSPETMAARFSALYEELGHPAVNPA